MTDLRQNLIRSLKELGLPPVLVELEVAESTLARCRHKSLARIIADLLNENEPLLKAEADGATVTVRERGGYAVMRFTVEAGE